MEERWTSQQYRRWLGTGEDPGAEKTPTCTAAPCNRASTPEAPPEDPADPGSGELTENELQRDVADYLGKVAPEAFHVPNGGKRRRLEAAILKGRGVRAGVPDWVVPLAGGRVGWIELKVDDGKPSREQLEYHQQLREIGHDVVVARSVAAVMAALQRWGRLG